MLTASLLLHLPFSTRALLSYFGPYARQVSWPVCCRFSYMSRQQLWMCFLSQWLDRPVLASLPLLALLKWLHKEVTVRLCQPPTHPPWNSLLQRYFLMSFLTLAQFPVVSSRWLVPPNLKELVHVYFIKSIAEHRSYNHVFSCSFYNCREVSDCWSPCSAAPSCQVQFLLPSV